jgi:hypothetical protein
MDAEPTFVFVEVVADQLVADHNVAALLEVYFEEVEYSRRLEDCIVLRGANVLEILDMIVVEVVGEGYVFVVGDNFFRLRKRVS